VVLQAVLLILVELMGGTGGTTKERFSPGPQEHGQRRFHRSHTPVPRGRAECRGVPPVPPVPPERRPRKQRRRICESRRPLPRPGAGRVIEHFQVENVEAARHNDAATLHFLLALQLATGFVGHQQAFGL
jgi:hypothetical protein